MKKKTEDNNPFRYGCVVADSFYCPRPSLERQLAGMSIRSEVNIGSPVCFSGHGFCDRIIDVRT
jgi:hypothetical protein